MLTKGDSKFIIKVSPKSIERRIAMKANQEHIQNFIKSKGWTVSKFASELGLSRGSTSLVIHGKRNPGGKFIGAFTKRFPDEDIKEYFFA